MRALRLSPLALVAVSALATLAACGEKPSDAPMPPPHGLTIVAAVRSTDPAIKAIQEHIDRNLQAKRPDKSSADWRSKMPMRPVVTFSTSTTYLWTIETEFGPIQVKLRTATAPEHAANAIHLALLGFFDGLLIHRIVPGKALESGDPAGDGTGGPDYAFSPETKDAKHDRRGLVSAVSLGDSTDDSKFRITLGADPSINPDSTIFGDVELGDDVLKKLEALGAPDGKPTRRVTILRSTVAIR